MPEQSDVVYRNVDSRAVAYTAKNVDFYLEVKAVVAWGTESWELIYTGNNMTHGSRRENCQNRYEVTLAGDNFNVRPVVVYCKMFVI